jgi:hypothetical protein
LPEFVASRLLPALLDAALHSFVLVGALALLTALMGLTERLARSMLTRSLGWWSVLWTGWIGVPVHEMSHLVACLLFRHGISAISLFSPDPRTGNLGHVDHTWNHASKYQRAGNFAIGIAPVVGGAAAMILLTRIVLGPLLDPTTATVAEFLSSPSIATAASTGRSIIVEVPTALLSTDMLLSWRLWLLMYLVMSIALHMCPSREDLNGSWKGFAAILGAILAADLIAIPIGGMPDIVVRALSLLVAPAATAMLLALVLNLAALALITGLTGLARHLRGRQPAPVS